MGKRVLAAFGVVAPMGGALASGLSAAPTSADAVTSSTAERTGSSEEARLRALSTTWCSAACRYCTPVGWKTVHPQIKALTGTYRFDYPKKPLAQHPRLCGAPGIPPTRREPATTWRTSAAATAPAVSRRSPCPASPPGRPGRRPASLLKNAPYQPAVKPYLSRLLSKDMQEHAIGA